MHVVRRNVWELGGDWADEVLWYARGVAAMKARPLAEPTSWRFYAAMHGFNAARWQELGYLGPTDQPPSRRWSASSGGSASTAAGTSCPGTGATSWPSRPTSGPRCSTCGGPSDWALPYWNYFRPDQAALPPAFASPDWPDGTGDNPLFVEQRYGPGW